MESSLLGQTAKQGAPEQGPSANPCPPEPLPAFGVLWEGMVEAAWRGLL